MLRSFAVVLTLIFIICFTRVKSSQYGGLFEPYHGTQPDNFNKSDEHGNKSSNSILMAVQTITEDSQISFAIAKAVASDSLTAVGIFVAGVCPGGGSSNIYTYLLDGDLSLSITMTTISTLLSLAMLPLWLYTLGSVFLEANNLNIPYTDIVVTLSIILIPLSVGLFIRIKFPKVTGMIEKGMAVVLTILALILITTGVISSLYLFKMFNLKIIAVGCILPYVGFCLGAVMSFIFKQPRKSIKTIAIETGMQNTAIAMILLLNSFPEPLGDIATVAPVSAEVMSPIPPFLASIVY
ncbi:ileal sodium/bile acid cotransporter-like [Mercenaria mercenaria]|uniref:ileal sodium/bile acid cotransporter-like n=1 Tax=Mercenaria mercenaria TaxID=6596 RepID=UPI00234F6864|nr:ileal sodium/bile acid cotransporter-like [Mercenaria mercenaria]